MDSMVVVNPQTQRKRYIVSGCGPDLILIESCDGVEDRLLTLEEAAVRLQVSPNTAYRLARAGKLPGAKKIGRFWRCLESTLEKYLNKR